MVLALVAVAVAVTFQLPLRDPDGVSLPTYVRLPAILLLTFLTDVVAPRSAPGAVARQPVRPPP